jgi:hypothetical protein
MISPKLTQAQKAFLLKCAAPQPTYAVERYSPMRALLALGLIALSNPKIANYYVLTDDGRRVVYELEASAAEARRTKG